jgi:DNA gyrase/topoisomerase IV subunit B
MPEIIKAGKLYKVFTPLYKIDDKDHPFVASKVKMIELYLSKIAKQYKIKLKGSKEYLSKSELQKFLLDTYEYKENLVRLATTSGKCDKYVIEVVLAEFIDAAYKLLPAHPYQSDIDKLFADKKFMTAFLSKVQKKFKEPVTVTGDNFIDATINKHEYLVRIRPRTLRKAADIIPIYLKYGYTITVKDKKTDEKREVTISEFMDMCSALYVRIIDRFKGLGEIDHEDLRRYAMDINNRTSVCYTMTSAKAELERMLVLHSQNGDYPTKRHDMMQEYVIRREDLDN